MAVVTMFSHVFIIHYQLETFLQDSLDILKQMLQNLEEMFPLVYMNSAMRRYSCVTHPLINGQDFLEILKHYYPTF